jgi:hypothetical protein
VAVMAPPYVAGECVIQSIILISQSNIMYYFGKYSGCSSND